MPYTIVKDDHDEFWIADANDYIAGPFKTLQMAEWELGGWEDDEEEDDE